jgi:hypothetical protein
LLASEGIGGDGDVLDPLVAAAGGDDDVGARVAVWILGGVVGCGCAVGIGGP